MTYQSDITDMVRSFLANLSLGLTLDSEAESAIAANTAAEEFGFGEPFDREQKTIKAMLIAKRANVIVCRVAWGFYYDSKLIEAQKPTPKTRKP